MGEAMRRSYYFNVHCEEFEIPDLVGEECPSLEAVRREALRTAQDLIRDNLLAGKMPHGWIEVEDEEHRPVMTLPLKAAAS